MLSHINTTLNRATIARIAVCLPVALLVDPYTIANLSAGVVRDGWEAVLYVTNLTDENANLSFDRERGGRARLSFRTNQPRTFGITLRKNFGG